MSNFSQADLEARSTENLQDLLDSRKSAIQKIDNIIARGDHSYDDFKQKLLEDMKLIQAILANR